MVELTSAAERAADEARNLAPFKDLALLGLKDKVATILSMIGRVDGIFSTYSLHDISHVEEMLSMLDWLVPPSTQAVMTPVDWLLIVLGAYLHDLGMVVTQEEYDERMENPVFCQFLDSLHSDPDGRDYLARTDKMQAAEKERFFYQEFIRGRHAARVREWITGRHSSHWGDTVKPLADEIAKMTDDLPSRFKEHLATVCESHHKDNLDKREYFPLYQRYGGLPEASANVQYAALLLRTVDLLHVTKDRTPSVMYKTLRLSDPTGVDEWKKQMGTFSVYPRGREFDPDDPETHVIVVSADFDEERPFFALTEYLAYASEQILQSKRWADTSQKQPDAENYWFPWHAVNGDILVEGHEPLPMKFELDRGRLLDLLVGHTLYNDPTVAVRELLQNAIDAVRYQHHLDRKQTDAGAADQAAMGRVLVKWDPEERILVVEDNGIGMDLDVITYHLMRVGASFYDTPRFQAEHADFTPISRFGIGILTCFMVSDDIEIVTCQAEGGYRIRLSAVQAEYLLKRLEPGNPTLAGLAPHGTRVTLKLRTSVDLEDRRVEDIVTHWVVLPACEVSFCEHGKEPVRVGFDSATDALIYYHLTDADRLALEQGSELEIRRQLWERDGARYELAFAVRRGLTGEHNFLAPPRGAYAPTYPRTFAPAVCIEGIRADEVLPGFTLPGLYALLSVTGNKRFRTTVSRTSLERDEEYFRVAELCAQLLFKHVAQEVTQIAQRPGRPLSQASTAASWLFDTLTSGMGRASLREARQLYAALPRIVVERTHAGSGDVPGVRELISVRELEELTEFWTVESRLIDYLGIISRDLGKELALNEFLGRVAPEHHEARITPIVCDAHQFANEISSSHEPESAEFSRQRQRSLVRWHRRQDNPLRFDSERLLFGVAPEDILGGILRQADVSVSLADRLIDLANWGLQSISCTPAHGDIAGIRGVRTRIALILEPQKTPAKTWNTLVEATRRSLASPTTQRQSLLLSLAVSVFVAMCTSKSYVDRVTRGWYFSLFRDQEAGMMWALVVPHINSMLPDLAMSDRLVEEPQDILGSQDQWFDASRYWLDWYQQRR